ncbi:hypothetical protein AB0M02_19850 [Actinoplanes sp. NPDC051861]|uniref:hypothetical protein n=1 Tax=Actinoplanes sp. NPDC051861 TaxID=3155170 RepID=UPI003419687A
MYLIPPMDDEPPEGFVNFVAVHARSLRAESARLTGGDAVSSAIFTDVLIDVAGHWRRLRWWGRLTGSDAAGAYLRKRLSARAAQWREDQVYEVEVRVLRPFDPYIGFVPPGGGSLALRKAAVIDGTVRASLDALADAEIAWVHAWRRNQWRLVLWRVTGAVLLIGGMLQYFSSLSTGGY